MKIELANCSKSFNNQIIINQLSYKIEPNSCTSILGNNGAGKSTLTLLLAGILKPTTGQVNWSYRGQELNSDKVYEFLSLTSPAMVLPEEYNISELLTYHSSFRNLKPGLNEDEIIHLCEFDKTITGKAIKNFSSGMKQRIKLCLAFFSEASLRIFDEPTENLDTQGQSLFHYLLEKEIGKSTIIIASNRKEDCIKCNDSIIL
jgi:ABC-type multidrug transport system ATPase subunit